MGHPLLEMVHTEIAKGGPPANTPPANSQGQPLPQGPTSPISSHQNGIGEKTDSHRESKDNQTVKELENDIKTGEWWLIRIGVAGIVTNAVIALIYFGQLKEMQKATIASEKAAIAAASAADTANRTMKLTYQPRIVIASLGPNVSTLPSKPGLNFLDDEGKIRMNAGVSNIGPVSAKNVRYFTFWRIIGKRENAKQLPYREARESFGHLKTILPKISGYDASTAFFTDKLTPQQIKRIKLSSTWTEFSVLITYDDDFGETHGTEYCDMFVIGGAQDICPWSIRSD